MKYKFIAIAGLAALIASGCGIAQKPLSESCSFHPDSEHCLCARSASGKPMGRKRPLLPRRIQADAQESGPGWCRIQPALP